MEGSLGGLQSKLLLRAGSAMTLDQGAHSFIQLGPENLQGWRQPNLSGQPTPLPASPQREKCVFISSLDLSSFS